MSSSYSLFPEVICLCKSNNKLLLAPISKYSYVEVQPSDEFIIIETPVGSFSYSVDTLQREAMSSFPIITTVLSVMKIRVPVKILIPNLFDCDSVFTWAPVVLGMISGLNKIFGMDKSVIDESIKVAKRLSNLMLEYAINVSYYKGIWCCRNSEQTKTEIKQFPELYLKRLKSFVITLAEPNYVIKLAEEEKYEKLFWFLYGRAIPAFRKINSEQALTLSNLAKNRIPSWFVGDYTAIFSKSQPEVGFDKAEIIF